MSFRQRLNRLGGFFRSLALTRAARRHARVGRPGLWKMKRRFQIDFLKRNGLQPHHFVADIGCGTLRGGLPIIEYLEPGRYFGLESRADVLDEARRELQHGRLEEKRPALLHADKLSALSLDVSFDIIWAFSVIIHMTDEAAEDCFRFVRRFLKPTGTFYANVNIGARSDGCWQGFPVVWREAAYYRDLAARHSLSLTDLGDLRSLGHRSGVARQDAQRMLAFRPVQGVS